MVLPFSLAIVCWGLMQPLTGALALPIGHAAWFYSAMVLAAGPVFATVTSNTVQVFELVGPQRVGLLLGVSFVVHAWTLAGAQLLPKSLPALSARRFR